MPAPKINPQAQEIGQRLRKLRDELGVKTWEMAAALEMTTEGYRMYEVGRSRIIAADLPRFAEALGTSPAYLARRLGILGDLPETEPLTAEEQAEFQALLEDRELGLEFATTARSAREWSDAKKRRVLAFIRQIREMADAEDEA